MKLQIHCDWCGIKFEKYESRISRHNFCCRRCLAEFSNKKLNPAEYHQLKNTENMRRHLSDLNRQMNPSRMTPSVREKIRKSRLGKGKGKAYKKYFGKHEHRIVAENILGRSLKDGEIVHHIDGNPQNNDANNLRVFRSQSEHARFHAELNDVLSRLGVIRK